MEAQRRWRRLVRARLAETARLSGAPSPAGPAFWEAHARRAGRRRPMTAERSPVVVRAARGAGRAGTVLDVGSGGGRLALPIAAPVGQVTAVDPSPAALSILRREARRRGLDNIRCVAGRWEAVVVNPADVAVCAHVLPLVADAAPFLRRLDGAAARVLLQVSATSFDLLLDPFWRHFHGRARQPAPSYLDAVAVLAELGIDADVDVVEVPFTARHRDLAGAARSYREQLALPDTAEVRAELRRLLRSWLVRRDGALAPPIRTVPAAIISWAGRPGR